MNEQIGACIFCDQPATALVHASPLCGICQHDPEVLAQLQQPSLWPLACVVLCIAGAASLFLDEIRALLGLTGWW